MVAPNVNNANYTAIIGNDYQVNKPLLTTGASPQTALAAHVNQFLMTHQQKIHFQGNQSFAINQSANGSTTQRTTGNTWIAQRFQSNGTSLSYVTLFGGAPSPQDGTLLPTTVQIYTDVAGKPGAAIASSVAFTLTPEYMALTPLQVLLPVAIPAGALTNGTFYWIVIKGVASASEYYYFWTQPTADTNLYASTSTNGTTWTNQTFGGRFTGVTDDVVGLPTWIGMDGQGTNAPWTVFYRLGNSDAIVSNLFEYWPSTVTNRYIQTARNLNIQGNNGFFQTVVT